MQSSQMNIIEWFGLLFNCKESVLIIKLHKKSYTERKGKKQLYTIFQVYLKYPNTEMLTYVL